MAWEIVVGIETHTQLLTKSKMFSGASTAFGAAPNSQASAVDIALPGVLPVVNAAAVEMAVKFGLAVGGRINRRSVFARKNYFYPDLPKGYQISQYEIPIVAGGSLTIVLSEGEKTIRLTRAHLEEDAGKSLHEDFHGMTGIDLNRAGTPLLEIVSEPELRGSKEAVAYARAMHALVRWIGICDGNMEEGSFRCDANVSVRKAGDAKLGTRCEIKNLNSFRFMEQAIEFEAKRQIEILEDGGSIAQETRLYDPEKDETRSMRSKEDAQDYRYFPDPDLLPLVLSEDFIQDIRVGLPELPEAMRVRFQREYGLSPYDSALITSSRATALFFELTVQELDVLSGHNDAAPKLLASWLNGELSNLLNAHQIQIDESGLSTRWLASLLQRVLDQTISRSAARGIFVGMFTVARNRWQAMKTGEEIPVTAKEFSVDEFIAESGLKQLSDTSAIEKIVDVVLANNPKQVEDYRAGKDKAFNSLVGQVMKATQGKANPAQVNAILKAKLRR